MVALVEKSGKGFGGQLLYVSSGLFGKREIEDILRMWNFQSKGNSRLEGKALRLDWWNPDVGCLRVKDCVKELMRRRGRDGFRSRLGFL
ncbi:hypothetical protein CK203_088187 [Vitis vinifera]|uniref:Uncharacterized protein n=1 Tax=Vitis vinifera TaxID=29760 RepID=A0A438DPD6_VITVI|nr:hypothetical protein CK203_088187 [Vitis vinifera]